MEKLKNKQVTCILKLHYFQADKTIVQQLIFWVSRYKLIDDMGPLLWSFL